MDTFDDGTELEFFDEPETLEAPDRPRRRIRPQRPGGPRRPSPPPPGAVALARLAGLVALAIVVVVGLVFWVGSCQGKSKHDEYSSYMKDIGSIAQNSAQVRDAFERTLGAKKLTLVGLQSKLEQWSRQEQQDYDDALRVRPPGPLQSAHQAALATFQLRAIGLTELANSLARTQSKSYTETATAFAQQAQFLSASDLVWANLFKLPATQTLTNLGVKGVVPPPSVFVPNAEVISLGSFKLVFQRLKSTTPSGKVTGLHGSELVSTEAGVGSNVKQLSPSTATTVNVGPNLAFKVTFEDSGNFPEAQVPVTLTVSVFGKQVLEKTEVVKQIASKQSATVSFGNLNLPTQAFGATATVKVKVGKVAGETNLGNNTASYPVFFSLSGG